MNHKPVRALFVHQGYELYGSDRSFLQSIEAFRKEYSGCHITAIIPKNGPLLDELVKVADKALVEPLFIARGAEAVRFFLSIPFMFPFALYRAWQHLRHADFLYINTVKVIDYMVAARFCKIPSMIHLREIYDGTMGRMLEKLVLFSNSEMVFNSHATAKSFSARKLKNPIVVHNGVAPIAGAQAIESTPDTLNILFLGRFNGWKGQDILAEAVGIMPESAKKKVSVRLIGDVFANQIQYKEQLDTIIQRYKLQDRVKVENFVTDIVPALKWAHVLVVPSVKPEPFGRVAAEALAAGRPVIASAHGGLPEIVENNVSGFLFQPANKQELANILTKLANGESDLVAMSKNALQRHAEHFSEEIYMLKMARLYRAMLTR